jgi:beta-galactosidase
VTYQPGEVKVIAYKDGKEWATATTKTATPAAKLELTPDRARMLADGNDLSFVTLRIVDKGGLTAPRANNRIKFSLDGPGEIVATDNGDPTNLESFALPERAAFNGYCLVIVRGKAGQPGRITLRAESTSLQQATVVLQSAASLKR